MAILNNLIVHGSSKFLNDAYFNILAADTGRFNKLATKVLGNDGETITVHGLMDVQGELHTKSWSNSNIATIDGSFFICPTLKVTETGSTGKGLTITQSGNTWSIQITSNSAVVTNSVYTMNSSGTVTTTGTWTLGSKVAITGEILVNNEWLPLGTLRGIITARSSDLKSVTISNITDGYSSSNNILNTIGAQSNVKHRNIKISLYEWTLSDSGTPTSAITNPIGIYMTALGDGTGQTMIDIYGGQEPAGTTYKGLAKPYVRIGNLSGLSSLTVGGQNPKGWGIYTSNGYFEGTIAARRGYIGNNTKYWTIGTSGTNSTIFSGPTTVSATGTAGTYLGTDGFLNTASSSVYAQITNGILTAKGADITGVINADTGRIGGTSGWTIASQQIYSTGKTIGANDSMFLSTKNLAGTVAGQTLTTTAPSWRLTVGSNFGVDNTGKLYASEAKISGNITATTGSISGSVTIGGTKTATTILNDIVEAGTKASNFISADEFGIMIYDGSNGEQIPSTISSGIRNIFIDNNSINIRNGTTTLSSFGEEVLIGEPNKASIRFSPDEIYASGNDGKEYFSFSGDGSELAIRVNLVLENNVYWSGYASGSSKTYVFDNAPVAGTSITCSIEMISPGIKDSRQVSFTAGTAGTKQTTFYYKTKTGDETTYIMYLTYDGNSTLSNLHTNADTPPIQLYLSVGYTSSVSTPVYSFGMDNIVTGAYATAIGRANESSGNYSFSEGYATHARGIYSHSEGYVNYSDGYASHSEGYDTTASGDNSHSEGSYTTASGDSSHSEGRYTTAFGNQSHASGDHTKANWCNSIVTGQYNIDDLQTDTFTGNGTQKAFALSSTIPSRAGGKLEDIMVKVNGVKVVFGNNQWNTNRYTSASITFGTAPANGASIEVAYPTSSSAFVIGNGNGISDDPNERSNALTVDWDGNITIQNHDTEIGHVYSASANVAISNTSIDANTGGASISLSAGTYIVIGQWHFNTRTTTGTTNSAIRLYRSGSGDNIAQTRIVAGANNWNCLQCMAIVELTGTETLKVCGATSRPYTTAQGTYITAVRIK